MSEAKPERQMGLSSTIKTRVLFMLFKKKVPEVSRLPASSRRPGEVNGLSSGQKIPHSYLGSHAGDPMPLAVKGKGGEHAKTPWVSFVAKSIWI